MPDMEPKIFEQTTFGKVALRKWNVQDENFRIYSAAIVDEYGTVFVEGAIFRRAKTGPYKGKLSIRLPGTIMKTYVTREEALSFEETAQ